MKNILIFVLCLVVMSGCTISGNSRGTTGNLQSRHGYIQHGDGVFEGNGQGYRGGITVQVRLSGGSITEIIVIDSMEDFFVGETAIEELIDIVIEYNTTDVDVISGATESSKGFLDAVKNAIMGL